MNNAARLTFAVLLLTALHTATAEETPQDRLKVVRFPANPIIRREMLPGHDGGNINGPSLIRTPAWLPHPLGKYYLYFASHSGKYIRLAYADRLEGPWKIHEPGTLRLEESAGCKGHIASPDAVVDDERKEIRLYFHGPEKASRTRRLLWPSPGTACTSKRPPKCWAFSTGESSAGMAGGMPWPKAVFSIGHAAD